MFGSRDGLDSSGADILIVDDNPANLLAMEAGLGQLGQQIVRAQSGEQALKLLLERDFAVILLDVQMPSLGGFETARLIRERRRSRHTPIIFITAYSKDDYDILDAYKLGAVDFLFKPVVPEMLRAKVGVFVDLDRRTRELARQIDLVREHERREHAHALIEEKRRWDEIALQKRLDGLREEARRKDEFLAMLGHELRTPLASIVVGLGLLREQLDPAQGVEPTILTTRDRIERQAQHVTRLVDDLLDLSRISSGKIELRKKPTSIADVLTNAVSMVRPIIEERRHKLHVIPPSEPLTAMVDEVRLTQVLTNLLSNAARYTDQGGNIKLHCERKGASVSFTVEDDGRGIEPGLLPHIFDLFVQETPGQGRGLGLGLTIVQRIVELHGGAVSVKSDGPGRGSVFSVSVPGIIEDENATDAEGGATRAALSAKNGHNGGPRPLSIALVEDSADIREMTEELLRLLGHTVESAEDGEGGVELILRMSPDVAIVDLGLPGLDGCGVARRVRETLGREAVRLIAMTGLGLDSDRKRAHEAGFDGYLIKPADVDALVKAITPEA
jgi:signal transduction histidine kinase